jgi:hypothetical protein
MELAGIGSILKIKFTWYSIRTIIVQLCAEGMGKEGEGNKIELPFCSKRRVVDKL